MLEEKQMSMVKIRQEIERKIVEKVIDSALLKRYRISVNDGEATVLKESMKKAEILKAMFSTDEDHLFFHDVKGNHIGWVFFIYGNSGHDVIHDYTTNLEEMMEPAETLANHYAD
jgi:hypothetical protein